MAGRPAARARRDPMTARDDHEQRRSVAHVTMRHVDLLLVVIGPEARALAADRIGATRHAGAEVADDPAEHDLEEHDDGRHADEATCEPEAASWVGAAAGREAPGDDEHERQEAVADDEVAGRQIRVEAEVDRQAAEQALAQHEEEGEEREPLGAGDDLRAGPRADEGRDREHAHQPTPQAMAVLVEDAAFHGREGRAVARREQQVGRLPSAGERATRGVHRAADEQHDPRRERRGDGGAEDDLGGHDVGDGALQCLHSATPVWPDLHHESKARHASVHDSFTGFFDFLSMPIAAQCW